MRSNHDFPLLRIIVRKFSILTLLLSDFILGESPLKPLKYYCIYINQILYLNIFNYNGSKKNRSCK